MAGARLRMFLMAWAATVVAVLGLAASALAAFPGTNGPIVFTRGPGPMSDACSDDIWSVNPDGSGANQITNTTQCETGPTVHPNNGLIAFGRGTGPMRASPYWPAFASGTSTVFVGTTAVSPPDRVRQSWLAWAPNGKSFVYETLNGQLWRDWPSVPGQGGGGGHFPPYPAFDPAFSPRGDVIAVTYRNVSGAAEWFDIWSWDIAGVTGTPLTSGTDNDYAATWSPDGARVAFARAQHTGTNPDGSYVHAPSDIYVMNADGSNVQQVTSGAEHDDYPAWSPDGTKIAFVRCCFTGGTTELFTVDPDGTDETRLTDNTTSEWDPDWKRATSGDPPGYPRVKGAANLTVGLVPAYNECQAPNREHGPSLAFPSCAPPDPSSELLTVGTPDANGQTANSVGTVTFTAIVGDPATEADEADLRISAQISDVRRASDLSEYSGEILAIMLTMRRIDKSANTPVGPPESMTGEDYTVRLGLGCAATAEPGDGARCSRVSTFDGLGGAGFIREGDRTTWEILDMRLQDAGLDNDFETEADNRTFAVPGLFVP